MQMGLKDPVFVQMGLKDPFKTSLRPGLRPGGPFKAPTQWEFKTLALNDVVIHPGGENFPCVFFLIDQVLARFDR